MEEAEGRCHNAAAACLAGCCYGHLDASAWLSGLLQAESLLLEYTQLGDDFTQIVQEYADTKVGGWVHAMMGAA